MYEVAADKNSVIFLKMLPCGSFSLTFHVCIINHPKFSSSFHPHLHHHFFPCKMVVEIRLEKSKGFPQKLQKKKKIKESTIVFKFAVLRPNPVPNQFEILQIILY